MNAVSAAAVFERLRGSLNTGAVHAGARRPFKFFVCGDPGAARRAARRFCSPGTTATRSRSRPPAAFETLDLQRQVDTTDARAVICVARAGDRGSLGLEKLVPLRLPVLVLIVDRRRDRAQRAGPSTRSGRGRGVRRRPASRSRRCAARFLPHLIDCCKGIEVAVGRRLPALRDTVAAKLTRDAAMAALKVAGASAVIDHVPILGIVLGAFASGADMFAITGIQMNLMLNIGATYGRDPDLSQMWELLPVVGGGFGWRALARELSGFIPVGGDIHQSRDRVRRNGRRRRGRRVLLPQRPPDGRRGRRARLRRGESLGDDVRARDADALSRQRRPQDLAPRSRGGSGTPAAPRPSRCAYEARSVGRTRSASSAASRTRAAGSSPGRRARKRSISTRSPSASPVSVRTGRDR